MTTTTAAMAVNRDSRIDFEGELIEENIPKATPVFRTYVMLNRPSITETDSLRLKRFWIKDLVQRSRQSVRMTKKRYGSRAWNFDGIFGKSYRNCPRELPNMVFS